MDGKNVGEDTTRRWIYGFEKRWKKRRDRNILGILILCPILPIDNLSARSTTKN